MKIKTTLVVFFMLILSGNAAKADGPLMEIFNPNITRNPFTPQFPVKKEEPKLDETVKKMLDRGKTKKGPNAQEVLPVENIVPPALIITGIIWNSDRPQAIINGQVVSRGDIVSEAKIISIKKAGIEIAYQGKTFSITP